MNETSHTENGAPEQEESFLQRAMPLIVACVVGAFVAIKFPVFAMKAVAFIATLGVLVFVHELGHFATARWAGMKVNRFGIGFPPWLFTYNHKGIDYSIGSLPIGGMVDIAGLGSEEEMVGTAATGNVPLNARNPHAPHGTKNFQDASLLWRFWTLFAGPLMNFIFAIGLSVFISCILGNPNGYRNYIQGVQEGMPAAKAGLKPGDILVGIKGFDTSNVWAKDYETQIRQRITDNGLKPLQLTIKRGTQTITKSITPAMGQPDPGSTERKPMLGIAFGLDPNRITYERTGFIPAVTESWDGAMGMTQQILGLVGRAVTLRMTSEERKGIHGVVTIAQVVGDVAQEGGIRSSLNLAAALSINLGLINLLPFPALDGGRILFLGYELVMRKPFNPRLEGIIHMAGMVLLLAFMAFIAFRDVANMHG